MHASPRGYRIPVFFPAFFYIYASKLMLLEFRVKDAAGITDHVQTA